eukprot:7378599-Prymnesium_polylepis.1
MSRIAPRSTSVDRNRIAVLPRVAAGETPLHERASTIKSPTAWATANQWRQRRRCVQRAEGRRIQRHSSTQSQWRQVYVQGATVHTVLTLNVQVRP